MVNTLITPDMLKNLANKDKIFVENFIEKIETDKDLAVKFYLYMAEKIGDKEMIEDFKQLSEDIQKKACIEYLIIGLTAGNLKMDEIIELLK